MELRAIVPTGDLSIAAAALPPALAAGVLALLQRPETATALHLLTADVAEAWNTVVSDDGNGGSSVVRAAVEAVRIDGLSQSDAFGVVIALVMGCVLASNDTRVPQDPAARAQWVQQQVALVRMGLLWTAPQVAAIGRELGNIRA